MIWSIQRTKKSTWSGLLGVSEHTLGAERADERRRLGLRRGVRQAGRQERRQYRDLLVVLLRLLDPVLAHSPRDVQRLLQLVAQHVRRHLFRRIFAISELSSGMDIGRQFVEMHFTPDLL